MEQLMEQTETQYVEGKTCHGCNSKHVVLRVNYQHEFLQCKDCYCIVEPKCDSCGTSLEITDRIYHDCEACGGFAAFARRAGLRSQIDRDELEIEKTEKYLKEVKKSLKEDKKNLKGWLIRAKKGELVGIETHELDIIEKDEDC